MSRGVVIAWHTPDERYTDLAETLRGDLEVRCQECAFYVIDKLANEPWLDLVARVKTTLWQRVQQEYPGRPLLFLDADCRVTGPLDVLWDVLSDCDFAFACFQKPKSFYPSTRVFYVASTEAADEWMREWQRTVQRQGGSEEGALMTMMTGAPRTSSARVKFIPRQFAGIEESKAPARYTITHTSAHKNDLWLPKRVEHTLRAAYRSVVPKHRGGEIQ